MASDVLFCLDLLQPGQVSYHNEKLIRKYVVLEKDKEVLRRVEKTRVEKYPDLAMERKMRDDEEKGKLKAEARDRAKKEKELEDSRYVTPQLLSQKWALDGPEYVSPRLQEEGEGGALL